MSHSPLRHSTNPFPPQRRSEDLGPSQLHARNRSCLEAMAASPDAATRLWWRNALVEHNLALVRMVAQRQSRLSGQPFDELVSAGNLGLIRAVEAFDLRQTCNFSSFAVPYIQGNRAKQQCLERFLSSVPAPSGLNHATPNPKNHR